MSIGDSHDVVEPANTTPTRAAERLRAIAPPAVPASFAQQRLWFVDRLHGGSTVHNLTDAVRVRGPLDIDALRRAVNAIVARHESLRTRLEDGSTPLQVVEPDAFVAVPVQDLRGLGEAAQKAAIDQEVQREWDNQFDLSRPPLLRVRLLELADEDHVLIRTVHHIAFDGWSRLIFNRELDRLYEAFRNGRDPQLSVPRIQYSQFSTWQHERWTEETIERGLEYWQAQLATVPQRLELPADRARPVTPTFAAASIQTVVNEELLERLKHVGRSHRASLYMMLMSAFVAVLARHAGQDDIVVGSPFAHRHPVETEDAIGLFINVVPIRVRVCAGITCHALLKQVRDTMLDASRHQDVPFERVVAALRCPSSMNVAPLVQVMFALQNVPAAPVTLAGAQVADIPVDPARIPVDLELSAREFAGRLYLSWVFSRELFDRWRIEQLATHFTAMLVGFADGHDRAVDDIALMNELERRDVTREWDQARSDYQQRRALSAHATRPIVREWLRVATEDAAALPAVESASRTLTHADVIARSSQIASVILSATAGRGRVVAIITADRVDLPAAIIGALRAGHGFVPLDPRMPDDRLRALLDRSAPALVLAATDLLDRVRRLTEVAAVGLDEVAQHHAPPAFEWSDESPAYVYFTSGSTGEPKGILGTIPPIEHFIDWEIRTFGLHRGIRVSQFTNPMFDAYLRDLFVPLCLGGTMCIPDDEARAVSGRMVAWLERAEVELVHCVPSMLRLLLQTDDAGARLSRLAHVLVSGERLLPADVERWYEVMGTRPRLVNLYGPTETTMTKFFHVVTPDDRGSRSVPIGRPMPGAAAIVLDGCGCACPPGLIGEIFIWTPHRTRGYIGQPELTAQVFVPNPLTGDPNDVVYRTGDWGRMRPDGVFEFVGRRDGQVKIRGVRVEIGEIESALLREPGVAQAAVVIRDFDGEPAILAYVERAGGPDDLRVRLSQQLPDYMVPRRIVRLDRLPLLPNGKIDRAALPLPRLEAIPGRAPVTAMEQTVSALYAELLGRECVDADADFFELGGHSLAASRLVNRVRSTLSLDLPIRAVFDYPRVSDLAVALEGASRKLTSSLSS